MDKLNSLVTLIKRQKIYQAELIDELDKDENKMSLLYNGLQDGSISNDLEAYKVIYNGEKKKENLKRLKNRLYHRLINSVFFLDVSGSTYSDVFEAAKTCYKYFAAIKLLIGNNQRRVAIDLAQKTISQSIKYDFTDLNFLLSSLLRIHFLLHESNSIKFKKYDQYYKYYLKAIEAETYVEELYGTMASKLSKSSSGLNEDEIKLFYENLPQLEKYQNEIKTSRFNLLATLSQVTIHLELKNYEKIIEATENGLNNYYEKGIKSTSTEFILTTRSALAHFLLKDYDYAEKKYLKNLKILNKGEQNWFSNYNHYFSLKIITKDYQGAFEIISKVFNNDHFESTHPWLVQLWKIKEAYIHFLIDLGKIDPDLADGQPLRKFRLARFMNDIPTYSKDKRGVNISILIIQMILLVQNKKYDRIIDRLDALNMYCHRYLRNDNTFRSNCFIKMLTKLTDADYHPIRWERYVKKLRARLDEHPFELSYHNLDMEVIPFETLYDLVVEMLEIQKGIKQYA